MMHAMKLSDENITQGKYFNEYSTNCVNCFMQDMNSENEAESKTVWHCNNNNMRSLQQLAFIRHTDYFVPTKCALWNSESARSQRDMRIITMVIKCRSEVRNVSHYEL